MPLLAFSGPLLQPLSLASERQEPLKITANMKLFKASIFSFSCGFGHTGCHTGLYTGHHTGLFTGFLSNHPIVSPISAILLAQPYSCHKTDRIVPLHLMCLLVTYEVSKGISQT